jgi:hypothetical protein
MNTRFRQRTSFALRRTIAALALSVLVTLANAHATTIASNTGGNGFNQQGYFGQSFTTVAGSPASNITFNFFSDIPATTPFASGTGFLLSMEYLGSPAALSAATPGFLGQAVAAGGFYSFASNLTLLAGTQYFFYENALLAAGSISGGNLYPGGQGYFSSAGNTNFSGFGDSNNFEVNGTAVPENSGTVFLLGMSLAALVAVRRAICGGLSAEVPLP